MSLRCSLGRHTPSIASISRKMNRFAALCERCGCPLERTDGARWKATQPLYDITGRS